MAGNRSLGSLTLDLIAKIGGFVTGMTQAERVAKQKMTAIEKQAYAFGRAIGGSLRNASGNLVGFAAGFASIQTAIAGLKGAIDTADKLNDFNVRLGVSAEALSDWSYAAQQSGTDIETLGKGLIKLQKAMAEALDPKSTQANLFKALGVDIKDAEGNLRTLEQVLPDLANAFKNLNNEALETQAITELFGKSGGELDEFLNLGASGLSEMAAKARELGIELSSNTLKQADEFNDTLGDLKGATQGLFTQIASDLLPQLKALTQDLIQIVKDGREAGDIAHGLANAFKAVGFVASEVGNRLDGFGQAIEGVVSGIVALNGASRQLMSGEFKGAWNALTGSDAEAQIGVGTVRLITGASGKIKAETNALAEDIRRQFDNAVKPLEKADNGLEGRLNKTFATRSNSPHTGKSEAERQAERTAKAINQMKDALRDWETELAGTGNPIADEYAKRLSDITEKAEDFKRNGIPAKEIENFKTKMQELAAAIKDKDLKEFQKEFTLQTKEMVAQVNGASTSAIQYTRAMDELNKQLKAGAINQEEFNDRAAALAKVRDADSIGILRGLKEEKETLGLSSDQLELYYNLKRAGTDASEENIKAITEETKALQEQRKALEPQIAIMDSFREGLEDSLVGIVEGTTSIKDAFKNLFDDLAAQITRWIAKRWIEQAFGGMGTVGQGSIGGGWVGLLSGLFGGGRAAGGMVMPGQFYRINESGPEMLSMGGRDYLMMGAQAGRVMPSNGARSTSYGPTNIYVAGSATKETIKQIDRANGRRAARELSRTGR